MGLYIAQESNITLTLNPILKFPSESAIHKLSFKHQKHSGRGVVDYLNAMLTLIPTFHFWWEGGGGTLPELNWFICILGAILQSCFISLIELHPGTLPDKFASPSTNMILGVWGEGILPGYIRVHCKSVRFTPDRLPKHRCP